MILIKLAHFLSMNIVRVVIFSMVGIICVLGLIVNSPFPSFWRDVLDDEKEN